jgi:hypothetical protein
MPQEFHFALMALEDNYVTSNMVRSTMGTKTEYNQFQLFVLAFLMTEEQKQEENGQAFGIELQILQRKL